MTRTHSLTTLLVIGGLAACQQTPADPSADPAATPAAATASNEAVPPPPPPPSPPSPEPAPDCDTLRAPPSTPEALRSETGARAVLLEWGRALENRQFDRAWCQFADDGLGSGMRFVAYAAQWEGYRGITVAMPSGTMEGAAGSSYYTAPTTITATANGKPVTLRGEVVLGRVNDVDGATPDQLRWTIRSANFGPAR